jgi:hypothetical protein
VAPELPSKGKYRAVRTAQAFSLVGGDAKMSAKTIGIILIIAGVLILAYQGITYTTREKVIDVGPIHATKESRKTVPLPPIIGAAAIAGGIILVLKRSRVGS